MKAVFAFATALTLGACASTSPATHSASLYNLDGYVHLVNDGRELFCHESKHGNYYDACYTRSQLKERLLGHELTAGPVGPEPVLVNQDSMYRFSPSGR
jgi:hypothetical protein